MILHQQLYNLDAAVLFARRLAMAMVICASFGMPSLWAPCVGQVHKLDSSYMKLTRLPDLRVPYWKCLSLGDSRWQWLQRYGKNIDVKMSFRLASWLLCATDPN